MYILHNFFSKWITPLALIMISAGCVKEPYVQMKIDETVEVLIDKEIKCPGFPENTCAIDSEFHEFANQAFDNSTPENPQHFVSLLNIGQDALLARLHLIRAARKSIDLQTFIWANDEVGRLMFMELLQAARRGVRVRLIADQLPVKEDPKLLARLATSHANLEISFYNPTFNRAKMTPLTLTVGGLLSFRKINQRMHNKVFIVDGRIGIVGGRNIENKYYDYDTTHNFKDRDVIVIGPAVTQMSESFERYWNDKIVARAIYLADVGQEIIILQSEDKPSMLDEPDLSFFSDIDNLANHYSICKERPACQPFLAGRVQFTADLPGKPSPDSQEDIGDNSGTMGEVVKNAQKSIIIQTPYLVISRTAKRTLKKIRKQNPDIQLTVSTNSLASTDAFMVYAMSLKHKKTYLKKIKFNLYELKPHPGDASKFIPRYDKLITDSSQTVGDDSPENTDRMPTVRKGEPRFGIHAKSIVVDGKIAIIGSHNLTPRSASLNTESAVIIWDENVARALEENILKDTEPRNSWVIAKQEKVPFLSHFSGLIGSISQMLPVFDIWPFRYASSYELKEGMQPLPHDHPDFYRHYENVGQFPGIDLSTKGIQTRLFKSFGGFTAPLM